MTKSSNSSSDEEKIYECKLFSIDSKNSETDHKHIDKISEDEQGKNVLVYHENETSKFKYDDPDIILEEKIRFLTLFCRFFLS